jgi:hypothetical protein
MLCAVVGSVINSLLCGYAAGQRWSCWRGEGEELMGPQLETLIRSANNFAAPCEFN